MPSPARLFKRFCAAGTIERLDFSLSWRGPEDSLKRYDQGPEIHGKPRKVSLPVSEAHLAGCVKVLVSGPLKWDAGIQ